MDNFLKATACILISLILFLALKKQGNEFATLITILVCCMVLMVAASYLKPILTFISELKELGNFDSDVLNLLLKAVGIGLLAEITSTICADAGNSSMGKALQILASTVILWLAIPLFTSLINIVKEILVII